MDTIYTFLRRIVRIFVMKYIIKELTGFEHIPAKGPVIIAMNHQSYFDFLCVAAVSPRNVHFLAAEKFFSHRLWSILMKVTRQIKVDRTSGDKKAMHDLVHSHIDDGRVIGIFPEGTRAPNEHEMLKAFSGVARYALNKKVPIIPVGIKGTFHVMSRHDKKVKFEKVVSLHVGEPMYFKDYHTKGNLTDIDYRAATHAVMLRISELSNKKYSHEA